MPSRRATALLTVAALVALSAGLLAARRTTDRTVAGTPARATIAQARVDALASVAERIYYEEAFGSPNSQAFGLISRLPGLISGLETGDLPLARRTLNRVTLFHVVHSRIVRGSRVLVDVGLKFIIAGQRRPLHGPTGTYLGRIEISIQDVIGFIKLFHRLTGAQIVVHGRKGHAKSSLAAALRLPLPTSGPVSVAGRTYFVRSFQRVGFAGEPLGVWILDPAA